MIKRYWLFMGCNHEENGGIGDFIDMDDDVTALMNRVSGVSDSLGFYDFKHAAGFNAKQYVFNSADWWNILDSQTGMIVAHGGGEYFGGLVEPFLEDNVKRAIEFHEGITHGK